MTQVSLAPALFVLTARRVRTTGARPQQVPSGRSLECATNLLDFKRCNIDEIAVRRAIAAHYQPLER